MKNTSQLDTLVNNDNKTVINIADRAATGKFARDLATRLDSCNISPDAPKILLCIGTDRSTGDCLGPLVGSMLSKADNQDFYIVYGTLDNPVHAANLQKTLEEIYENYQDPFIIAIDASLGKTDSVGCVNLADGSLWPGAGVKKKLPPVGQLHITGIVNIGGFMEYLVLQNTRLNIVMRLAEVIANGLSKSVLEYKRLRNTAAIV